VQEAWDIQFGHYTSVSRALHAAADETVAQVVGVLDRVSQRGAAQTPATLFIIPGSRVLASSEIGLRAGAHLAVGRDPRQVGPGRTNVQRRNAR
jgi:hypothetical protein